MTSTSVKAAMPTYHFTSPSGLDCSIFDPNGAIFYKGRYHLGYIHQEGGRHLWGHVSSTDLVGLGARQSDDDVPATSALDGARRFDEHRPGRGT